MKTSLTVTSFLFAAGLPASTLAAFLGLSLPDVFDAGHIFCAFVGSVTIMTMIADYSRSTTPLWSETPAPAANITQFPRQAAPSRAAA